MIPIAMPAPPILSPIPSGTPDSEPQFVRAATSVMERLRRAMTALVSATPGEIRTAADFHRAMGVDAKLGWQVYRIAHAESDLASGLDVPSAVSMRKLLKAAVKQRVPQSIVRRASQAFEEFEVLVQDHAGDREAFMSMLSAFAGDEESQIDFQHRRSAFAANSHIMGVQARTRLTCAMWTPAPVSRLPNLVNIRGLIGLRWLRANNVPVLLGSELSYDRTATEASRRLAFVPIDPDAHERFGGSLLPGYCSQPLGQIETVRETDGSICTVLRSCEVGNISMQTYMVGSISTRPVDPYRQGDANENFFGALVRIPCQTLVHDVLMHESYLIKEPSARVYSDHEGGHAAFKTVQVPLMQKVTVSYLGNGAEVLHSRDVPRYAEMVEDVAKRLSIDLEPLRVYRCRVEYPFMPSSVVMYFDAPEKPE